MKIQCPCGAKYVIDVTPGMQQVQFVCPNCGQDYSSFVNQLIEQELGEKFPAVASAPPPAAPTPPKTSGLRISHSQSPAAPPPVPMAAAQLSQRTKHVTESFEREAKFWRKFGLISGVVGAIAALGIGFWIWYAWYGSMPRPYFSVKFDQISHTGGTYVSNGQIIFLHGGTLARYDLKSGKQIWTQQLVSQQQIDDQVKQEDADEAATRAKYGRSEYSYNLTADRHQKLVRLGLEAALSLHCAGQNVWVSDGEKLTRYDWNTGNSTQQIAAPDAEGLTASGNELLAFERAADGAPAIVHIDLSSGALSTNEFPDQPVTALAQNAPGTVGGAAPATGGLPLSPQAAPQPMNPQRVAQQAQNLNTPGRLALPAIIANNSYEQRIEAEMGNGQPRQPPAQKNAAGSPQSSPISFTLVHDGEGFEEFSVQMIQENFVQREAMKAPAANSSLNNVTSGNETAAVNETLNEMQRNNGGDKVTEDDSIYLVTVRKAGSPDASWTNEVVGPPALSPLKTVNVVAAGKTVIVLDKSNKKLWQADLTYNISTDNAGEQSPYGTGPVVERGDTLYVFDQAVLSAFDLATGNARWRVPTVGVVGLFFDDKGNLFVNTTTGNPDDIKYSRQIDVDKSTEAVLLKIAPATGKILWSAKPGGFVCYLSGQFMYAVQSFDPGDQEDMDSDATAALMKPPLTRIMRINPDNGETLWRWEQQRAPMDVQFDGSFIRIVFKKEVEVLHYLAL